MPAGPAAIVNGGRGGIRTHGPRERTPVFKTGAFNRSATLPDIRAPVFQTGAGSTPHIRVLRPCGADARTLSDRRSRSFPTIWSRPVHSTALPPFRNSRRPSAGVHFLRARIVPIPERRHKPYPLILRRLPQRSESMDSGHWPVARMPGVRLWRELATVVTVETVGNTYRR